MYLYYIDCIDETTYYGIVCICITNDDAVVIAEHVMKKYNLETRTMKYQASCMFRADIGKDDKVVEAGYYDMSAGLFSPDFKYFECVKSDNFIKLNVRTLKIDNFLSNM